MAAKLIIELAAELTMYEFELTAKDEFELAAKVADPPAGILEEAMAEQARCNLSPETGPQVAISLPHPFHIS